MMYLIAYDVRDDKIRRRVAEALKNAGGQRIQYSAFLIELEPHQLEDLLGELRLIIGPKRGRVMAIPICKRDIDKIVTIIHNYTPPEEPQLL